MVMTNIENKLKTHQIDRNGTKCCALFYGVIMHPKIKSGGSPGTANDKHQSELWNSNRIIWRSALASPWEERGEDQENI